MATCRCGRSYIPNYDPDSDSLDMCPACIRASNGGGYLTGKEWVCGNITNYAQGEHPEEDNNS